MVSLKKESGEYKQVYISLWQRHPGVQWGILKGENGGVAHVLSLPPPAHPPPSPQPLHCQHTQNIGAFWREMLGTLPDISRIEH